MVPMMQSTLPPQRQPVVKRGSDSSQIAARICGVGSSSDNRRSIGSSCGVVFLSAMAVLLLLGNGCSPCDAWSPSLPASHTRIQSLSGRSIHQQQQQRRWHTHMHGFAHGRERLHPLRVSVMGDHMDQPAHSRDASPALVETQPQQQLQQQHDDHHQQPQKNDNQDNQNGNVSDEVSPKQQAINAIFLAATFGYAIFTILNIDEGMTRGWSASEIAMRIPLDNWGNYESCLANQPVMTKTLINVIIYLLGDWLSQTAFAGNNLLNFDLSRTLRNGFIGLCFGPLVHEYYQFSDSILPPEDGLVTRLEKILMDQTIYLTVKCSIYISAVGLLSGDDWPTVKQTVQDKIGGIVVTAWKFWPLIHCITYGLIPARHRILWVNSVDLIWNAILASKAQKGSDTEVAVNEEQLLVLEQQNEQAEIVYEHDDEYIVNAQGNMTAVVA